MFLRVRGIAFLLIGLLVVGALAGACSRGDDDGDTSDVTVELSVEPESPSVGPATITVVITDDDGDTVGGADLEIVGDMSHAGMVPVIVGATEEPDGRYISDGFEFTMGGDWIITVRGTLPDGEEIERRFDIKGVSS